MKNKYLEAKAKVLSKNKDGTYIIGFQCPDCESGYITTEYTATDVTHAEGDIIEVKISAINKDQVITLELYDEKREVSYMPDLVKQAKEIGIYREQEQLYELEESIERLARWTRAYINDLPNSAFAVVEPCYGETTDNKNARHLPYKDATGKVDLPHLRNALARLTHIRPVCSGVSKESLVSKARGVLEKVAKRLGVGRYSIREQLGEKTYRIQDTESEKYFVGLAKIEMDVDTFADQGDFERIAEEHEMSEYTLLHHWWDNGKFEHWDLFMKTEDEITHMVLETNPLKETEIKAAQRQPYADDFWLKGEKMESIAPGEPGNPSKNSECFVERLDMGKVAVYESAPQADNSFLLRLEFFGKTLEGRWSFSSTVPNIWHALKETTKLTDQFSMDIALSGDIGAWKETADGLEVTGTALSFGVWNGLYWSPDVILNSPLDDFDNMIVDVEHDNDKVVGAVTEKHIDGPDVNVRFKVTDYETIEKIKNGEYKGLSIDARTFVDPVRRIVADVKKYTRLTVCRNPACKVCYFGS